MRFIQVHDGDHAGSHGTPVKGKPGWTRDATCWINLEQVVSFDISDLGGGSEHEPDGDWLTVSMVTTNGKLYFSPVEFHTVQQALDWVLKSKAAHNMTDSGNKAYPGEKDAGAGWSPVPKDFHLPTLERSAEVATNHGHWSVEVPEVAPFIFYTVTRMHVPDGESELREVTVASMIRHGEVSRVLADNAEHADEMNVYRVTSIRTDNGNFTPEDCGDAGDDDLGGPVTAHVS